jgi:predicted transcriptional regulator
MTTSETPSLRRHVIQALEQLPDDVTIEDIVDCLDFVHAVLQGLADADQGKVIPHDEVMRRMRLWPD